MSWIVNVKKMEDGRSFIWLSEAKAMESGVMIATGRKTPGFVSTAGGDLVTVEESLRRSLGVMTSEPMLEYGTKRLIMGCMVGKQLEDILLDDGGDDIEQVV